jgi:hypothetical protein
MERGLFFREAPARLEACVQRVSRCVPDLGQGGGLGDKSPGQAGGFGKQRDDVAAVHAHDVRLATCKAGFRSQIRHIAEVLISLAQSRKSKWSGRLSDQGLARDDETIASDTQTLKWDPGKGALEAFAWAD